MSSSGPIHERATKMRIEKDQYDITGYNRIYLLVCKSITYTNYVHQLRNGEPMSVHIHKYGLVI